MYRYILVPHRRQHTYNNVSCVCVRARTIIYCGDACGTKLYIEDYMRMRVVRKHTSNVCSRLSNRSILCSMLYEYHVVYYVPQNINRNHYTYKYKHHRMGTRFSWGSMNVGYMLAQSTNTERFVQKTWPSVYRQCRIHTQCDGDYETTSRSGHHDPRQATPA